MLTRWVSNGWKSFEDERNRALRACISMVGVCTSSKLKYYYYYMLFFYLALIYAFGCLNLSSYLASTRLLSLGNCKAYLVNNLNSCWWRGKKVKESNERKLNEI